MTIVIIQILRILKRTWIMRSIMNMDWIIVGMIVRRVIVFLRVEDFLILMVIRLKIVSRLIYV